ncbi:hypothetical protein PPL_02433 [Heterostelium album PN500]|uniref:Uncharacterized protein n=1 Tax=Heterostelium pallidum (strain ATCC 26659 / Pp 5 / PN500) TaxID=670386 RepID=D3AZP9_HETP5|nr:hypothetical protein PPL_02433 [Heterostelium album PN500]EFA85428.1 hypothetical protein PPL_02433 [Heterostelium album PN500]|eukprot:XP_020437537.1 hypothetical protein PPL_02433 [Heterostelium album PN500]
MAAKKKSQKKKQEQEVEQTQEQEQQNEEVSEPEQPNVEETKENVDVVAEPEPEPEPEPVKEEEIPTATTSTTTEETKDKTETSEDKPKIEEEEEEVKETAKVEEKPKQKSPAKQQQQQQQKQSSPPQQHQPKPAPAPTPAPVSSGWGGWFSSVASAVSSTINNALADVEPDPEPIIVDENMKPINNTSKDDNNTEEKQESETETTEKKEGEGEGDEEEDEVEGLLGVIDKSVFKTADLIADSLMFAGNLFSSGLKTVQENAKMENVKGLAQNVADLSIETTRKAANSEIYEKGQKIASQMMDTSVERLESVGQRAYTMFSETKKNIAASQPTTTTTTSTSSSSTSPTTSQSNVLSPSSPKSPNQQSQQLSNSGGVAAAGGEIDVENEVVFKDSEFDSTKCFEHFKVNAIQQEIERITIESTMKIHQFNRKLSKENRPSVEIIFSEIKDLVESDEIDMSEKPKNLTNVNCLSLLSTLQNNNNNNNNNYTNTTTTTTSRLVHLTALGLELIDAIGQASLDEKPENADQDIKQWTLSKAKDYSYLINKIISDIKSVSSILTEIIKTKQNPQTRKFLNTISIETNNTISIISDCRASFVAICSIMYINQTKNK